MAHENWIVNEISPKPIMKMMTTEEACGVKELEQIAQNAKPGYPVVHILTN